VAEYHKRDQQFGVDLGRIQCGQWDEARDRGVSLDTVKKERKAMHKRQHDLLTYFILAENGQIKIGRTTNLPKRLQGLATMIPMEIELLGVTDIAEKEVHAKFAEQRINGEWFQTSPELEHYIKVNCWAFDD